MQRQANKRHESKGTAGKYQVVQDREEKSGRRFCVSPWPFELKTTPHPLRSCFHNNPLCKHNSPIQAGELWRLLFRFRLSFSCFSALSVSVFALRACIMNRLEKRSTIFPCYPYTVIIYYILLYPFYPLFTFIFFSPFYNIYIPPPFFISPLAGLWYIVIYIYIPPEALFSHFPPCI